MSELPEEKWTLFVGDNVIDSAYSRKRMENKGMILANEAFNSFVKNWRNNITESLNEQIEENNASKRVHKSSAVIQWAFEPVDKFEQTGLKLVRIDETDRKDYLKQYRNIFTSNPDTKEEITVFMVPAGDKKGEDYHFFGMVVKLATP